MTLNVRSNTIIIIWEGNFCIKTSKSAHIQSPLTTCETYLRKAVESKHTELIPGFIVDVKAGVSLKTSKRQTDRL